MWILQFPADLVIFTEEILNGKLHFFCSVTVKTLLNFFAKNSIRDMWQIPKDESIPCICVICVIMRLKTIGTLATEFMFPYCFVLDYRWSVKQNGGSDKSLRFYKLCVLFLGYSLMRIKCSRRYFFSLTL